MSHIYGDDGDGNSEYERWSQARDDIESSGLLKKTHSQELTYGEFDLRLLSRALALGLEHLPAAPAPRTFVDIGSGYGRAAHGAAALLGDDWGVVGLEIVPAMHDFAGRVEAPWASRTSFVLGDYAEEGGAAEDALTRADFCFAFATTWPSAGTPYLAGLTRVLGDRLCDGAVAMTADKQLVQEELGPGGERFEEVARVDGPNRCCGDSTVFVYKFRGGRGI